MDSRQPPTATALFRFLPHLEAAAGRRRACDGWRSFALGLKVTRRRRVGEEGAEYQEVDMVRERESM